MKCEDRYGNPASDYRGEARITVEKLNDTRFETYPSSRWDGPDTYCFTEVDAGCHRLDGFSFTEPGMYRFKVETDEITESQTHSNVIPVYELPRERTHYWGDLHAQFNNALGTGSVVEAWRYARDAGGVDFTGHQPNDFQFATEGWQEVKDAIPQFHVPGKFVPFLGYEWSGTTPAGGDRNVHYLHDDGPLHRTSHWHVTDKSDEDMDRYPLDQLYDTFRGREDVIIVPHVGGRRCDISRYYDPELEPVIEICSCHGRFEWLLHEALANGFTVGVVGGSDDHTGRPGASYATSHSFGTRGGLAGVYAKELTREDIFAALKARHTYATTGERIWLQVETADGYMMGDQWEATDAPRIRIQAAGTKPIERLEIIRNHDVVYAHPIFQPGDYQSDRIRVEWGGARVKGRGRHSTWDGRIRVKHGSIAKVEKFAFDHPQQGITYQNGEEVRWRSTTSGDHDGLILHLDRAEDAVLHFTTDIAKDTVAVSDLNDGPIRKACGGVGQYYAISQQPVVSGPLVIDFNWQDPDPIAGRNAYWIRLVQEDGEMAWSSPLYFHRT